MEVLLQYFEDLELAYDAVFHWYDKYNELLREIEGNRNVHER